MIKERCFSIFFLSFSLKLLLIAVLLIISRPCSLWVCSGGALGGALHLGCGVKVPS